MCGGFGTRLAKVSKGIPKALLPITHQKVYLDILLEKIFQFSINRVYLSLHYKSELFDSYINQSKYKSKLRSVIEKKPLGTGGAVKNVLINTNISAKFITINGDSLSNINLYKMREYFFDGNFKAMVGVSKIKNVERYGRVEIRTPRVHKFYEKGSTGSGWINNGYYYLTKEIFENMKGEFSLEKSIFPKLANDGELYCFKVENDNFIDIGIPEDYKKICNMFKD